MMMLFTVAIHFLSYIPWTIGAENDDFLTFPNGFKIGVAGSAYQIEGAWNASDKGLSNWDSWTHGNDDINPDKSNGDIACDSYNRYEEDIQLVKDAGFDHYRLSLSWSRIIPNGYGEGISSDGIKHYKNVLDGLRAKMIEPFVSIYHWDHPEVLEKMGGWLNESMIEFYADYARIVFKELGSRVKFWTTINEPNIYCNHAFGKGIYPPGIQLPTLKPYICGHNMLKAHARAYRIYDEEFRAAQNGLVGIVNSCLHFYPVHVNDSKSSDIAFQYNCGWLSHPIYSKEGNYPKIMRQRIEENSKLEGDLHSRLPVFSRHWIDYIRGTFDYFGLNYYTSRLTENAPKTNKTKWFEDSGIIMSEKESWPVDSFSWLRIVPEGLRGILKKIKAEYDNPPVYIMENGVASDVNLEDYRRIDFLYHHMKEMLLAVNVDGCNVKAYTIWSLFDSFEWDSGYTLSFGIVHVNMTDPNLKRTPRLSVTWLNGLLKSRKLTKFKRFSRAGSSSYSTSFLLIIFSLSVRRFMPYL